MPLYDVISIMDRKMSYHDYLHRAMALIKLCPYLFCQHKQTVSFKLETISDSLARFKYYRFVHPQTNYHLQQDEGLWQRPHCSIIYINYCEMLL